MGIDSRLTADQRLIVADALIKDLIAQLAVGERENAVLKVRIARVERVLDLYGPLSVTLTARIRGALR